MPPLNETDFLGRGVERGGSHFAGRYHFYADREATRLDSAYGSEPGDTSGYISTLCDFEILAALFSFRNLFTFCLFFVYARSNTLASSCRGSRAPH